MSGRPYAESQMGMAAGAGILEYGNIDLHNRPVVHNAGGSVSTVRSITIEDGGRFVLIPTVVGRKVVSNDEAIQHYRQTGEHLGVFNSERAADKYAQSLHQSQAAEYDQPKTATPVSTASTATGTQGLDPGFSDALSRMIAASGGRITIQSGYRSPELQASLYNAAIKKYGSPEAASKWVAPPGRSNHNRGWAADLGGDLEWAHAHAAQYGLVFPMSWERWHIEPVWARSKSSPDSYTTAPAGEANPTSDASHQTGSSLMASFSDNLRKVLMGDLPGSTVDPLTGAPVAAGSTGGTGSAGGVAGAAGATGPGSLMSSPERVQWAQDFLTKLGKPVTAANITAVVAWQQAESGGGGGRFNPLNTTQGGFQGETNLNSVGVKNYQSYEDGIAANVKVINNGRYGNILAALDAGNDPMAVARAVAATPWGTGAGVERVLGQNPTIIQPPGQPKPAAPQAAPAAPAPANPNQPRRVKMS